MTGSNARHGKRDAIAPCAARFVFSSVLFLSLFAALPALAEEDAHKAAGLPQFDFSTFPQQIFWLLIVFVFLYGFFARNTLPTLSRIIENRREHVQSDIDSARRLGEEAAHVQKVYEDTLGKAREEASAILSAVVESSRHAAEEGQKHFHERAEREISAVERRFENARNNALESINSAAAEAAAQAVEKLSGLPGDIRAARAVIDDLERKVRAA